MLRHALQRPRHACQRFRPISACFASGTLLLRFIVYKAESGRIFLRCGTPRTLQNMPRSAKDLAKHAEDVAKHAEVGRGRCQACLRRCKACLSMP